MTRNRWPPESNICHGSFLCLTSDAWAYQDESTGRPADLMLRLKADCESAAKAEAAQHHLEQITGILKAVAARQKSSSTAPDLTGLLASGTFRAVNTSVEGFSPISQETVDSLLK